MSTSIEIVRKRDTLLVFRFQDLPILTLLIWMIVLMNRGVVQRVIGDWEQLGKILLSSHSIPAEY